MRKRAQLCTGRTQFMVRYSCIYGDRASALETILAPCPAPTNYRYSDLQRSWAEQHHGRMNAYSEDFRKKIVEAVERRISKIEAVRAFGVGISSVKRYSRFHSSWAWER